MKRGIKLFSMFAATMGAALFAFGAGVTGDDAKGAVTGWVRLREALGDEIDAEPESVTTYQGADGRGEFHVVSLKGGELAYPNEKPDRFVKWANAPGANYVPVAVRAKSGVRAEMKFRPEGTGLDQYFLAARNSSTTDTRFLLNYLYRKSASNNCIAIGYKNKWCGRNWQLWSPGKDYALSSEIASDGTLDGNLVGDTMAMQTQSGAGGALGAFDTGLGLYMFAANMGGNAQDYYTGRFYFTTIDVYDEAAGEYRPARDLKPCVKDGNVMFYDAVSKTMFKPFPAIPAEGNVNKDGLTIVVK